ncbi:hypothetical protein Tco_1458787 [Tanacetum coccineum]
MANNKVLLAFNSFFLASFYSAVLGGMGPSVLADAISALVVARKGRPKMNGTSSSLSISKTMKSTGKMNLLTFTSRFFQTPIGYLIDRSASRILILVDLSLEIPNRRKKECGMIFILAPKSAKAFFIAKGPIRHGSMKLPRSPSFWGRLLWMIAEHSSLSFTEEAAFSSFFLMRKEIL